MPDPTAREGKNIPQTIVWLQFPHQSQNHWTICIARDFRGSHGQTSCLKLIWKGPMRMVRSTTSRTELPKTQPCLRTLLHVFVSFLPLCLTFTSWNYFPSMFLLNKKLFPRCLVCFLPSGGRRTSMASPVKRMTGKYVISSYTSEFKAFRNCCKQTNRQVCVPMLCTLLLLPVWSSPIYRCNTCSLLVFTFSHLEANTYHESLRMVNSSFGAWRPEDSTPLKGAVWALAPLISCYII